MHLQNQYYTITASVEITPPLAQFDMVYNLNDINIDDFYIARTFNINSTNGTFKSIAFIGLLLAEYEPYAVLEKDCLTLILFDSIVRIDLSTGLVKQRKDCKNWGGLHEIHAIKDGYIIWGECDIFRYDLELNQIWQFSGRDILVSLKKDEHFWIENSMIHCRDFLGWHYVLDFNGNLIYEIHEIIDPETP